MQNCVSVEKRRRDFLVSLLAESHTPPLSEIKAFPDFQKSVLQGKIAVSSAATFAQQQGCEQQQWVETHVEISRAVRAFRRQQTPEGPFVDL